MSKVQSRFLITLVATAGIALVPASAAAAQAPLVDDTPADFAAGTPGAGTWVTEPGALTLRPMLLSEGFDEIGADLPASLTAVSWSPMAGSATVDSGSLTLDGVRVHPATMYAAPQGLQFRATFADVAFEHVGFGDTFNDAPWAMFSTGGGSLPTGLYARTSADGTTIDHEVTDVDPLLPHDYRIEWSPDDVKFFVDGALVATHEIAIATPMRPVASDFADGFGVLKLDWLGLGAYPSSGDFESRVHDAGDERAVWGVLTTAASSGGTVAIETRSGNTPSPDATWSPWQSTGTAGAIASPIARYIQYRTTLSHPSGGSPSLERVEIDYAIDTVPPTAAVDGVDVARDGATVRFSSADGDVDRFECRLDEAPFATCTSPHEFSELDSGSYTVFVRAVDQAGNVGPEVEQAFVVDLLAPTTTIDGVGVAGDVATVRFSSADGDVDRFECRLDSAPVATCASPHEFAGLASGLHTVSVRAVDEAGNVGAAASQTFTIPSPPASGGSQGSPSPPPVDDTPEPIGDATAPAVKVLTRSARPSRRGVVALRVACPGDEARCRVTVRLKHGRKMAGRKTVSVLGGERKQARVRMRKAILSRLTKRGRLKLIVLLTARDDAGNLRKTRHRLILRLPAD